MSKWEKYGNFPDPKWRAKGRNKVGVVRTNQETILYATQNFLILYTVLKP